jgi:hypothetical protein
MAKGGSTKAGPITQQTFFIPVVLPGLNEIIDARARYFNKGKKRVDRYQQLKKEYENLIVSCIQLAKLRPIKKGYFIFNWIEENRKRDPDNIAAARKFILDALVTAGILRNDGWSCVGGWHDSFTVKKGRQKSGVGITIWPSERG